MQKRIVTAIKQGATYELAAQYGGVAYNTFNEWMKRGQEETEGEFTEFHEAIKSAEGQAAVKWLRVIEKAGRESWQAMAWKLERRYPHDYGRQVQEHTVDLPPDSNFEKALSKAYSDNDPDTP